MKRLQFNGSYSELKDLGFDFQKRFASNQLCWDKNGVDIYKKGNEVLIEQLGSYSGAVYELLQPIFDKVDFDINSLASGSMSSFRQKIGIPNRVSFYFNEQTGEITLDKTEHQAQEKANFQLAEQCQESGMTPLFTRIWQERSVALTDIQIIFELHNKNWLKLS